MSTEENTCAEECCQDCTRSFCESCTESCEENCQESCNQACSDACSNACSDATCTCGSTTENAIFPIAFALGSALFTAVLVGILQAFDSHGPILVTLFGSTFLAFNLSGIQITKSNRAYSCYRKNSLRVDSFSTRIGRLSIKHSHHPVHLIKSGHEFQIKNKYFCTGCYGILVGTIISVAFASYYLLYGLETYWVGIIIGILPFCFLPIILRYTLPYQIPSSLKFVANSLLPIGCSLLLLCTDLLFQNWSFNMVCVLLILTGAFLRGVIGQKTNRES